MRISFQNQYQICNPSFNGNIDKLINSIKEITDYKHSRITLNDAIKIYNKLGYNLRKKAGSHMTVTAPSGFEYSLQLPHGNEKKFIHPFDVKRLQYAINGDMEGLMRAIKI